MERVMLVCTGLGHVNRGYETFSSNCYAILKTAPEFETYLIKGKGKNEGNEVSIFTIPRSSFFAKAVSRIFGVSNYDVEQVSFFFSLLPKIIFLRPTIIYFPDFYLGCLLHHLKRIFKLRYQLLFHNSAPNGPPFHMFDYVHHVSSKYMNEAIKMGESPLKHFCLPIGVNMEEGRTVVSEENKIRLKDVLSIPRNKKIILSVGAINAYHKRVDYLIREFSKLNQEEYFLLLLGQFEDGSEKIVALAKELLKDENYLIATVDKDKISEYYRIADYFVLCSLSEGFGIVYLEAMSYGLPVLCQDTFGTREIFANMGTFGDFTVQGELKNLIAKSTGMQSSVESQKRIDFIYHKYSWNVLSTSYRQMIQTILKNEKKN